MEGWADFSLRQAARIEMTGRHDYNLNWAMAERGRRSTEDDNEPREIAGGLTPEAKALARLFPG